MQYPVLPPVTSVSLIQPILSILMPDSPFRFTTDIPQLGYLILSILLKYLVPLLWTVLPFLLIFPVSEIRLSIFIDSAFFCCFLLCFNSCHIFHRLLTHFNRFHIFFSLPLQFYLFHIFFILLLFIQHNIPMDCIRLQLSCSMDADQTPPLFLSLLRTYFFF